MVEKENQEENESTVRRMPVERGPSFINDFKAWVGRLINRDNSE